jgi:hypothetical protein
LDLNPLRKLPEEKKRYEQLSYFATAFPAAIRFDG